MVLVSSGNNDAEEQATLGFRDEFEATKSKSGHNTCHCFERQSFHLEQGIVYWCGKVVNGRRQDRLGTERENILFLLFFLLFENVFNQRKVSIETVESLLTWCGDRQPLDERRSLAMSKELR